MALFASCGLIDIHSHILFGTDDGAETIGESVEMLKLAEKQGVRNVFCTSHHWSLGVVNYEANLALLREKVKAEGIGISLYEGMEILCDKRHLDGVVQDINNSAAKSLNGTDYVLVEMFPGMAAEEIFMCAESVFERTGKKVILAHVERYESLCCDGFMLACLKELGCLFQINAYSLVKESDGSIRGFARKLLSEKLVDFIGSDAHRMKHRPPDVSSAVRYIYENCDSAYADAICFGNAEKLFLQKEEQ